MTGGSYHEDPTVLLSDDEAGRSNSLLTVATDCALVSAMLTQLTLHHPACMQRCCLTPVW